METFNSWDQGFLPGVGWVPSETETRQGCIQSRIILDEFTLQAALRLLFFCAVVDLSHLHMLFQIGSRSWCFEMERHGSQASEPTCVFMISEGCGLLHSLRSLQLLQVQTLLLMSSQVFAYFEALEKKNLNRGQNDKMKTKAEWVSNVKFPSLGWNELQVCCLLNLPYKCVGCFLYNYTLKLNGNDSIIKVAVVKWGICDGCFSCSPGCIDALL